MSDSLPLRKPDGAAARVDILQTYLQRFDRDQTRRAYETDIASFFGTSELTLELVRAVSFLEINQYLADLEASGYKPSTLKRRLAALRGFFDWLRALELIDRNPTERQLLRKIRGSTARDRKIVFLSSDQARRLIDATSSHGESALRDRALLLTLLHCVLRRSEAAAMDVSHVRPLGRYWIVDLPDTKGGADQYVKIPEHVVEAIDEMRRHYGIDHEPLWRSLSNNSFMKRLSDRSIYSV